MPSSRPLHPAFKLSLGIVLLLALVSAWAWSRIPAGTRIPIHWNLAGKVDGYGGRGGLFIMPVVMLGVTLLFWLLPKMEPRQQNLLLSSKAYQTCSLATLLFLAGLQGVIVGAVLGHPVSMGRTMGFGLGALFVIIGNALGKVRSNFFFGVRTPWTLSSELSWNRTHRLAGGMMVAFGLIETAAALAQARPFWLSLSLLVFVLILLATTSIYSYRVWRADPDKTAQGRSGDIADTEL